MEQEKKKINVKIIIPIVVVIIAVIGIIIFASNKQTPKGLTEKDIIGTWETESKSTMFNGNVKTIILYQGGTGKGIQANHPDEKIYYDLRWEIKDNIVNIDLDRSGYFTTGYIIENGKMTSVDNKYIYIKVE